MIFPVNEFKVILKFFILKLELLQKGGGALIFFEKSVRLSFTKEIKPLHGGNN